MSPVGSLWMVMAMPPHPFNKFLLGAKNVPGIILCLKFRTNKVPGCMELSF